MEGPEPGSRVTPFIRLERRLRSGGMGSVWLALHEKLGTEVVVKFMSPALCEESINRARFMREAAAAAQVRSPHVVQMLDHGVMDDGTPFLVMEYLEGSDLGQVLADGPLTADEVAQIIEHVACALDAAHRRGVVHRDVKPANIFLTHVGARDPFAKLVDFGVAKASTLQDLTCTGEVIGTPVYMSPEQIEGRSVDCRCDLWALGVVAFRALTGRRPFAGDTVAAIAYQVVHGTPPKPSDIRPELSPAIDDWFRRSCARQPEDRFASAREMADELWRAIGRPEAASTSGGWPSPARSSQPSASLLTCEPTGTTVPASESAAAAPSESSGTPNRPPAPSQAARPVPAANESSRAASCGSAPPTQPLEPTGGSLQSSVSTLASHRGTPRQRWVLGLGAALTLCALIGLVAVVATLDDPHADTSHVTTEEDGSSNVMQSAAASAAASTSAEPTDREPPAAASPSSSAVRDAGATERPLPRPLRQSPRPIRPKADEVDPEDLGF